MIFLVIFLLMLACHIMFEIPWYAIILAVVAFFALVIIFLVAENNIAQRTSDSIKTANLVREVKFYKKKHEYIGCSYGNEGRRDHYEYKDVLDYIECTFSVTYNDGRHGSLVCRKGSALYNRLILKNKV